MLTCRFWSADAARPKEVAATAATVAASLGWLERSFHGFVLAPLYRANVRATASDGLGDRSPPPLTPLFVAVDVAVAVCHRPRRDRPTRRSCTKRM
jgi:hypothetical protein